MKPNVRTLVTVSLLISYICLAQGPTEPAKIFTPSTMIWKENAVNLLGDPFKPGPFVVRLKMLDKYRVIPPHWHPEDENITVIEGTFLMGMGDKVDKSAMREMPAGSFATMPKGMHHFVSCRGATVVQLHGMGPLVFKWVNPEDDPDRKKP